MGSGGFSSELVTGSEIVVFFCHSSEMQVFGSTIIVRFR